MGCGCKKKQTAEVQPNPQTININGIQTPVVTQPAPDVQQQNEVVDNLNKIN